MFKSRENRLLLLSLLCIFSLGMTVILLFPEWRVPASAVMGTLIILVAVLFTWWRYKKLSDLAFMLQRGADSEVIPDIQSEEEGELSLLYHQLQKVMGLLSSHRELLQQEKEVLGDSISDISHQLKTPLTSMFVLIDLLRQPNLPEEKRKEFMDTLDAQLSRMQWLIEALLKISKLDSKTAVFRMEWQELEDALWTSIEPLEIPIELKNATITIQNEGKVRAKYDKDWTREAILNVLKNALEHSPEGGKIDVKLSENGIYSEISIRDYGEGLEKEDLPHVFDRFYRGKNASSESVGIGLALAATIMETQGGSITVESKRGEGTTFYLRFYKVVV